jgi:tRNA A-37 threonylcarbamoyl transferase component Bud32
MSGSILKTQPYIHGASDLYLADGFEREDLAAVLGAIADPASPAARLVKHNSSRTVWRVQTDDRAVYVKRYHPRSLWGRLKRAGGVGRARRELEYAQYLLARGVPAPTVLACGVVQGREYLVSQAVEPAQAADLWHMDRIDRDGPADRRQVALAAAALGELVGRMHAAGVIHGDLHCGNVLVRTDAHRPWLVLLDLHRMHRRRGLSRRQMTANLAQLYYDRFNFSRLADRLRFLKHYLAASGAGGSVAGWACMIEDFARRHARRQLSGRDRRIFASNTYFAPLRLGRGWRANVVLSSRQRLAGSAAAALTFEAPAWREAISRPEALFEGPGVEVVKDSPSSLVVRRRLRVGPHEVDVFIKRSRRKHPWKWPIDCLRPSRSKRAFELGHVLLARRIATALPLAALERRWGPLLRDNILITEAVEAPQLHRFLEAHLGPPRTDTPLSAVQQRQLAQQVLGRLGVLVRRLHDNRLAHRDLKANNLLVKWSPQRRPEVVLVDLDGLKRVRWMTSQHGFGGLMRLNVSLLECPVVNHAGRLRMLLGYLRRGRTGRLDFKPYWRVLEDWSAKKLRRQIRSRRRRQRAVRRPQS